MSKIYTLPRDEFRGEIYRRIYLLVSRQGGGWRAAGAALGLAGGVLSIPLALVLWAAAGYTGPAGVGPTLHALSTILFVLSLPLLAVGACFLDLLEKKTPALPLPAERQPAVLERWRRLRPRHPHHN